jgi:hypothetical protein
MVKNILILPSQKFRKWLSTSNERLKIISLTTLLFSAFPIYHLLDDKPYYHALATSHLLLLFELRHLLCFSNKRCEVGGFADSLL